MKKSADMVPHLDKAAQLVGIPLYWTDTKGHLTGANDAWLALFGLGRLDSVIGKLPSEYLPEDAAFSMSDQIKQVLCTQRSHSREEVLRDPATGKQCYVSMIRAPLVDNNGNLVGIVGSAIDMTTDKELALERTRRDQLTDIKERESYNNLAQKIAHDIQSPLTALSVMVNVCDELNEAKRLILKNAFNAIKDIANNILTKYSRDELLVSDTEPRLPVLCSDFILKSVSERKYQYQELALKFDVHISSAAQFAFIHVQPSQLSRAIANLINNAVDAAKSKPDAKVSLKLEVDEETVKFTVQDNGKGMSRSNLEKIVSRSQFTEGKENGHGLGMMQVWDMIENNGGKLDVCSQPGLGTRFELTFARQMQAEWILNEITFRKNDIVIILDDDQLIHDAWNLRLAALQSSTADLIVRHEKQGQAVLDFIDSLSPDDRERIYLLCDFELINQNMHGLQIVEACNLERVALVTSYFNNPALQKTATQMGIKILPKQMASVVPIFCINHNGVYKLSHSEVMYDKNYYTIEQPVQCYLN